MISLILSGEPSLFEDLKEDKKGFVATVPYFLASLRALTHLWIFLIKKSSRKTAASLMRYFSYSDLNLLSSFLRVILLTSFLRHL